MLQGRRVGTGVKRYLLLALLPFASIARADQIDDYIKGEMSRLQIPALTYGIVRNGELARSAAIGMSDIEGKKSARTDDLYDIASLTKQFTAMGVMMLVESGRIDLEDPIGKFLPDIPKAWTAIKVRHLLNQNSGLHDYALVPGIGLLDKFDRKEFMEMMGDVPIDFKPGDSWEYSNTNYALLGWIVEKVASEPFPKFIKENIFGPLGMTHTSFAEEGVPVPGLAKGYIRSRGQSVPCRRGAFSVKADGGIISTLADMVKWDTALRDHRLVSRKTYNLMWKPGVLNDGRTRSYGMGWFLSVQGGGDYMGHGGNDAGYSCGISRFPRHDLTVILFCNLYPVGGEVMTKRIAELFDPSLRPHVFQPASDPDPKRTERVKAAILALASGEPDDSLLESELTAPMNETPFRVSGPSPWNQIKSVDDIQFGGSRPQDHDTWLTYHVMSKGKGFTAVILWTEHGKMVQGTLYADPPSK